jgi:hypothetical protein
VFIGFQQVFLSEPVWSPLWGLSLCKQLAALRAALSPADRAHAPAETSHRWPGIFVLACADAQAQLPRSARLLRRTQQNLVLPGTRQELVPLLGLAWLGRPPERRCSRAFLQIHSVLHPHAQPQPAAPALQRSSAWSTAPPELQGQLSLVYGDGFSWSVMTALPDLQ